MIRTDLEFYYQKSLDNNLVDGMMERIDNGWFTWSAENDVLFIYNACGDGKAIMVRAREIANKHGCQVIRCATKRDPKSYVRKHGFSVIGYVMEVKV